MIVMLTVMMMVAEKRTVIFIGGSSHSGDGLRGDGVVCTRV